MIEVQQQGDNHEIITITFILLILWNILRWINSNRCCTSTKSTSILDTCILRCYILINLCKGRVMGYRNYLAVTDRKSIKNYKQILKKFVEDDGHCSYIDFLHEVSKEVYELGKYSDEGSALESYSPKIPESIATEFEELKQLLAEHEYGFNYVNQRAFKCIIDSYQTRSGLYYTDMVDSLVGKPGARLSKEEAIKQAIHYFRKMANEYSNGSIVDTDIENKCSLTSSWDYAMSVFNLAYIYKTFNWENDIMIVVGY